MVARLGQGGAGRAKERDLRIPVPGRSGGGERPACGPGAGRGAGGVVRAAERQPGRAVPQSRVEGAFVMVWERISGVARQSDLRQAPAVAAAGAGAFERDRGGAGALPVHRLGGISAQHVRERRRVCGALSARRSSSSWRSAERRLRRRWERAGRRASSIFTASRRCRATS